MTTKSNSKVRNTFVTVNNWTEEQWDKLVSYGDTGEFKYLVFGKEIAPTTGTPHLHIYAEFKSPRSVKSVGKMFFNLKIEAREKTALACSEYCKKNCEYLEYGTLSNQGKRVDVETAKEIILKTGKMADIVDKCNLQTIKICEKILTYKEPKRTWKPEVLWFYGPSESGKTRLAMSTLNDPWVSGRNLKWWEGYDAHTDILVDDFRADFCTYHELLRILDRYEYRVEVKGGSRQLLAKRIIITSQTHPRHTYATREDIKQLVRRVDKVLWFPHKDCTPVEITRNETNIPVVGSLRMQRPEADPIVRMDDDN